MKIYSLEDKNWKSCLITENVIHVSSKNHKTVESFENSKKKKGMLESFESIVMNDINKAEYVDNAERVDINYLNHKGKNKSRTFSFNDPKSAKDFSQTLQSTLNLESTIDGVSPMKNSWPYGLGLVLTPFFIWVFRMTALEVQNGTYESATGRRSGMKNLLAKISGTLGPNGVLILGILIFLFVAYLGYKAYTNPPNKTTYTKRTQL